MKVKIYGIGRGWDDIFVGTAYDAETGRSLLRLLRLHGVPRCSLHGPLCEGAEPLSGEMSLEQAENLFNVPVATDKSVWLVSAHTGEYEDKQSRVLQGFTSLAAAEESKATLVAQLAARGLDKYDRERTRDESWFYGLTVDYTGATVAVSGPFPLHT